MAFTPEKSGRCPFSILRHSIRALGKGQKRFSQSHSSIKALIKIESKCGARRSGRIEVLRGGRVCVLCRQGGIDARSTWLEDPFFQWFCLKTVRRSSQLKFLYPIDGPFGLNNILLHEKMQVPRDNRSRRGRSTFESISSSRYSQLIRRNLGPAAAYPPSPPLNLIKSRGGLSLSY